MRVTFDQVSISLGGTPIIHDASLNIESGHTVGILGANGSGKSSLLRSLYLTDVPVHAERDSASGRGVHLGGETRP